MSIQRQEKVIDYLKHMTTLCTGSLLLITTFFDKLADNKECVVLVRCGIVGFVISLGGLLLCLTILTFTYGEEMKNRSKRMLGIVQLVSWASFFSGIVCLAAFAWVNNF